MKKVIVGFLTVSLFLGGCTQQAINVAKEKEPITFFVATDLHYLSPTLTDGGEFFQQMMLSADGKLTEYSEEILDQLVQTTIQEKPNALLLTGDLTFNGEKQSLVELRDALRKVTEQNIPVYVLPGNHDIEYTRAYSYEGNSYSPVDNITEGAFKEMMQEFGYAQAMEKDESSFSYVVPLASDVWLIALDANTKDNPGELSNTTITWLEKQLKKAQEDHIQVITMSHQNVLKQNDSLYLGYVMNNYEAVSSLLQEYGVTLNLSGHSHLQHISQEGTLTDICNESLALYPISYAKVQVGEDRTQFTYEKEKLGVYEDESYQRFYDSTYAKLTEKLSSLPVTEEEKKEMVAFATKANIYYFSQQKEELAKVFEEDGWKLWQKYGQTTFWYGYLISMKEGK